MDEAKMYTIEESHQAFAKMLNGKVWGLLQENRALEIGTWVISMVAIGMV